MAPVILLGGIYGGIFTPTEAAGIALFELDKGRCCVAMFFFTI